MSDIHGSYWLPSTTVDDPSQCYWPRGYILGENTNRTKSQVKIKHIFTILIDLRSLLLPRYRRIFRPGHQRLNSTSQLSSLHVLTTMRWGPQIPVAKTRTTKKKPHNTTNWYIKVLNGTYPLGQLGGPYKQQSVQFYRDQFHLRGSHWGFSYTDLVASPHQFADILAVNHVKEKELCCGSNERKKKSMHICMYVYGCV